MREKDLKKKRPATYRMTTAERTEYESNIDPYNELKYPKMRGISWSKHHLKWKASYSNASVSHAYESTFTTSYDTAVAWRKSKEVQYGNVHGADALPPRCPCCNILAFTEYRDRDWSEPNEQAIMITDDDNPADDETETETESAWGDVPADD